MNGKTILFVLGLVCFAAAALDFQPARLTAGGLFFIALGNML